ncbi:MAG: replication factor C large subunit [Candidatus Bathyarchaeia archaeon]|nr:replication factor C large subunit [Candidatus Bathyarchaeota archaeon]
MSASLGVAYIPWTQKYKPKSLSEVIGNDEAKRKIVEWIRSWERGIPDKRAIFIYGPPGVGKTVTVEALANDMNMELIESDASNYRTEEAVRRLAGRASQFGSLFGRRKLILFDELDGITGSADTGGLREIGEIIKTTRVPVILIANDAFEPRFASLRNLCLLIEFKKPSKIEVMKHLAKICAKEGINADEAALRFIAERSGGDVRSAINDLQALAQGKTRLTYEDVSWLASRDRKEEIFNVLRMIFYAKDSSSAKAAVNMADVDLDMLFEWIYENAPHHIKNPHELAAAMDALSKADIYRGRIKETQDWSLIRYVIDLMTAGVASSWSKKSTGWTPFKFPERIKIASASKEERDMLAEIGKRIGRKCHLSSSRAIKEVLPYLRIIFQNNPKMGRGIAKWLDLNDEMITYITESEPLKKT